MKAVSNTSLLLALAVLLPSTLWAAGNPASPPTAGAPAASALAGPGPTVVADPNYRLGPEDILSISVVNHEEYSKDAVVLSDGTITYPIVGTLKVAGMTQDQVRAQITQVLKSQLVHPDVTITVKTPRQNRIYVTGMVHTPGYFDLRPGWRVSEAVAAGAGLADRPELLRATIFRKGRPDMPVDLKGIFVDGNKADDLPLQVNDVLDIEQKPTEHVMVTGQVGKPGFINLETGLGTTQAIAEAGSYLPTAALTRASIIRADHTVIPVDLHKILVDGDTTADVRLKAGDTLVVPENQNQIQVLGNVNRPGVFPLQDGQPTTVTKAIALAGGAAVDKTKLRDVAVLRMQDGKPKTILVNVDNILNKGKMKDDLVLQPGDEVFVPRSHKPNSGDLMNVGGFLLSLWRFFPF